MLAGLLAAGATSAAEQASRASGQESASRVTILHAGVLIDVPGEPPKLRQSIVIRDRRIESISDGYVELPDAQIIDLTDKTVLPGLIDCHVHLLSRYRKPGEAVSDGGKREAEAVLTALENASVTLAAGFTTVRDLGADSQTIFTVRDAIAAGRFPGPRVLAAGRIVSVTAGHGDDLEPESAETNSRFSGICDGPYECRRAVRAQIGLGADVIKISTTGGGGDGNGAVDAAPEMRTDEILAAVETAHALKRRVAAHAHGTAGINAALQGGVDSVEHGGFLDAQSIRLLKSHRAFLVPTMSVLNRIEREYAGADPKAQPLMRSFLDQMPDNVAAAYRSGVQIAFGTDAGVTEHGKNAQEFAWYAKIGMTPADALRTATTTAASLLGLSDQIGTIARGKDADIIATRANPLRDVSALQGIVFVMKQGKVVRDERSVPVPVHVIPSL